MDAGIKARLAAIQEKLGGHSIFAPSASHRWMKCPGSLIPALEAGDEAGEDAAIGTVAHLIADQWLTEGEEPLDRVGEVLDVQNGSTIYPVEVTYSMLRYVREYVNWVLSEKGHVKSYENRVDFSRYTPIPGQSGTADALTMSPGELVVQDLKFGIHIQVFAQGNTQLLLYVLGAYLEWDWLYDFKTIRMGIGQPRIGHWDWAEPITPEELLEFGEEVLARSTEALRSDAPRVAGASQCKFCPDSVKAVCPAMLRLMEDVAIGNLNGEGRYLDGADLIEVVEQKTLDVPKRLPSPRSLTIEQQLMVRNMRPVMESFMNSVAENLNQAARDGQHIPGMKLVRGRRGNRAYRSDKEVRDKMVSLELPEDFCSERKMIPVKSLEEKLLNAKFTEEEVASIMGELTHRRPGAPTLVAESDPRPPVSDELEDVFGVHSGLTGWDVDEEL